MHQLEYIVLVGGIELADFRPCVEEYSLPVGFGLCIENPDTYECLSQRRPAISRKLVADVAGNIYNL